MTPEYPTVGKESLLLLLESLYLALLSSRRCQMIETYRVEDRFDQCLFQYTCLSSTIGIPFGFHPPGHGGRANIPCVTNALSSPTLKRDTSFPVGLGKAGTVVRSWAVIISIVPGDEQLIILRATRVHTLCAQAVRRLVLRWKQLQFNLLVLLSFS